MMPHFCRADLSAVIVIKSKYWVKISVKQKMKVEVYNLIQRFEKLCSVQQAHASH